MTSGFPEYKIPIENSLHNYSLPTSRTNIEIGAGGQKHKLDFRTNGPNRGQSVLVTSNASCMAIK